MGDVINLDVQTTVDIPVNKILESAVAAGLDKVIVIGMKENDETYYAMSISDLGEILLDIELFKQALLDSCHGD